MKHGAPFLVAAAALLAHAAGAHAAPLPTKDGHPDLSGFWQLDASVPPDSILGAKLALGAVVLNDTGAPELPRGDYGGLKPTAAAADAAANWKPEDDLKVAKACSPPSIIYAMQGPFPIEVHQGRDMVVIKLEYFDLVRVIFTDGRGHTPPSAPHSKTGHSIGHWEGDTLVVDTDHLEPATLTNNGLDHGDKVHVVERFRLSPDGRTLLSTQEFEDPDALENRGARYIGWKKEDGQYVAAYDCDPSFGLQYEKR